MGALLLLLSLLLTHSTIYLTALLITTQNPTTSTIDKLYAAHWLVTLMHALITMLVGEVLCYEYVLVLMDVHVSLLYPYGWLSLGYWVYDLISLALLANKSSHPNVSAKPGVSQVVRRAMQCFLWVAVINTDRQRLYGMVAVSFIMEFYSVFVAAESARLSFKNNFLCLMISICMVHAFLLCRMVLVPGVIHLYSVQQGMNMVLGVLSMPRQCVIATLMFYGLNCYWFALMVKECIKVPKKQKEK